MVVTIQHGQQRSVALSTVAMSVLSNTAGIMMIVVTFYMMQLFSKSLTPTKTKMHG